MITRIVSRAVDSFNRMYVRYYMGLGSSERMGLNEPTTMYAYRKGLTGRLQVQWEGPGLTNLVPEPSTLSLAF